jgi:hypothetical protein
MTAYVLAGAGFLVVTLLLAWYITGYGLRPSQHFAIGFRAMLLSYLLGATALFVLATRLA